MPRARSWREGFLAGLSPAVREKLLAHAQEFHYAAEVPIFREGEPSRYFYVVKSGRVAVDIHIPSKGRRCILTAGPGEVFSWSALVQPCVHHASARSVEDTEALGIDGRKLAHLCRHDAQVGFELYRQLSEVISARLTATRLQMVDVLTGEQV